MPNSYSRALKQAIGLGAIAGLRASVAPAIASNYLSKHPDSDLRHSKLRFLQKPATAILTKVLSVAEFVADKAPGAPDRIIASQLAARISSGALVGATMFKANRESSLKGAMIGGAAALVTTFASFYGRKYLDKVPHVKDTFVGAFEDAIAVSSGVKLMKN
ncbi:hypothetical protein GCM10027037_03530 [Mucilaginibacter koreensis]